MNELMYPEDQVELFFVMNRLVRERHSQLCTGIWGALAAGNRSWYDFLAEQRDQLEMIMDLYDRTRY